MQNSKTKKVKTFRISQIVQYKLTKLTEKFKKSEGKVISQLIETAYYRECDTRIPRELTPEEKELIEIANTEWVGKF